MLGNINNEMKKAEHSMGAWEGEIGLSGKVRDCGGKVLCRMHRDYSFRIPIIILVFLGAMMVMAPIFMCVAKKKHHKNCKNKK